MYRVMTTPVNGMDERKIRMLLNSLTVMSRPKWADAWVKRGFKKINARGRDNLYNYWQRRLAKSEEDRALFWRIWGAYQRRLKAQEAHGQKTNPPPLIEQAQTLGAAAVRFIRSGASLVGDDVFNARLEVCRGCDQWDSEAFLGTGRCLKCGCSTKGKLRLPGEGCPLEKWLPVVPIAS